VRDVTVEDIAEAARVDVAEDIEDGERRACVIAAGKDSAGDIGAAA